MTTAGQETKIASIFARDVRAFFKEKVFETSIPRNVRLAEAPSHGKPAILYTTHISPPSTGDPEAAELPSIVGRTPACPPDRDGFSPNLKLFQP